jgi:Fe-S cluster assembly protein SufD
MGGFDRQAAAALYAAADGDWFSASRQAARAAWLVSDWPGRKTEEWKYTSLSALETDSWLRVPPVAAAGAEAGIPGLDAD